MSAPNGPDGDAGPAAGPGEAPHGGWIGPILAVASLAFRESARNRVLHALIGATLFAVGLSFLVSYVSGGDSEILRKEKIVQDLSLSAIGFLGTVASIFLGTNLIYQEVERRTIHSVLARPIGRRLASSARNLTEAPLAETKSRSSSPLTSCAEINSSPGRRLIAASPLERIESNSRSRLFLTIPSRVARTR